MMGIDTVYLSAEVKLTVSITELEQAFTEWDRRYREEPELFESEAVRLKRTTPETYGETAARTLLEILEQLGEPRVWRPEHARHVPV